jgi:hypothetical protein
MKTLQLFFVLGVILLSGCKKECGEMLVVRDCTGTYLQHDGKDYQVCNIETLSGFTSGTTVNATYHKIASCSEQDETVVCMMFHAREGWIVVDTVE